MRRIAKVVKDRRGLEKLGKGYVDVIMEFDNPTETRQLTLTYDEYEAQTAKEEIDKMMKEVGLSREFFDKTLHLIDVIEEAGYRRGLDDGAAYPYC